MIAAVNSIRKIGASHVGAILGVSDYSTAFDVWLHIVEGFRLPASPEMRKGSLFERAIGAWFAEDHRVDLRWYEGPIDHPTREWQRIAPDVRILSWPGEIADIKRARDALHRHGTPGTDEMAEYELVQLQTYLEALHSIGEPAERAHLIVHDLYTDELVTWRTLRDPDFGALIVEECERFWRDHVLPRRPPAMSGSETARAWLERRRPKDTQPARAATVGEATIAREWRGIDLAMKDLEARRDVLRNVLRESIADARGVHGDFGSISYAAIEAQIGADWEAIARELARDLRELRYPDIEVEHIDREIIRPLCERHQRTVREAHRRLAPHWRKEK